MSFRGIPNRFTESIFDENDRSTFTTNASNVEVPPFKVRLQIHLLSDLHIGITSMAVIICMMQFAWV